MHVLNLIMCGTILHLSVLVCAVEFSDCGSTGATVVSLDVSECDIDSCTLVRGTLPTFSVNFIALRDARTAYSNVRNSAGGSDVVHFPQSDVCPNLAPPCPIRAGVRYTFSYTAVVADSLQPGSMSIRWEIFYGSGAKFMCIEFKAQ
ncbi:Niemann-Pick C2 protein, partial [Clonorchis sinensis]